MANQYTERIAEETPPQEFMGLPSKTASQISGTDYMMMVNNSEAYKALVNDVAEAILSKLTSKSFSGLETTAKNVIGALNELNSKTGKFVRDKQEFDACAAEMTGGIAVYINSITMSELTGTKFKLSSKGVISNDGLNTDFILSVGPGDTIITGRIVDGEMISLYQYKGTVVS